MAEDKIVLQTQLKRYDSQRMTIESLIMMVAELYQRGIEIGWETKILDPLNDALRKL